MKHIVFLILIIATMSQVRSATYVVTNTNESGSGSLRQAVTSCLNNPGGAPHSIIFQIPLSDPGYNAASGVWTIVFFDEGLPPITIDGITIDGSSQTSFAGNTNPNGPEICLNGSVRTVEYCFSILNAANNTIKGLIINEFLYGIQIYGQGSYNNRVIGCYLGCNYDGTQRHGNVNAIEIISGAHNNHVGEVGLANRNLISGNEYAGIRMSDSQYNIIINNFVGVNRTGSAELHNYDGITVEGAAAYNKIGGSSSDSMNVASGNVAYGIDIFGVGCIGNAVQGNLIGTDITGTYAIPNTYGLLCDDRSNHNLIGGYVPGQGNLISGNTAFGAYFYNNGTSYMMLIGNKIGTDITGMLAIPNETGVHIDGASYANLVDSNLISGNTANGITVFGIYSDYNTIIRNKIGTDISGNNPLPNGVQGILITQNAANNTIGGSIPNANTIAFNGNNGVKIESSLAINNLISCNSIHSNGNYGIELFPDDGPNPNDAGDNDAGPNNLLNTAVITGLSYNGGNATLIGTIDVQNPLTTRIEIYRALQNAYYAPEGMEYLGFTGCDVMGNWSFTFQYNATGDYYTTLAIDSQNNTSEFSVEYPLQITTYNVEFGVTGNPSNGTISAMLGGSAVTSPATVTAMDNISFTASPDPGYQVKEWLYNGNVVQGNQTLYYMISAITSNATIYVEFEPVSTLTELATIFPLTVYPNPVKMGGSLVFRNIEVNATIAIRNIQGTLIYRTQASVSDHFSLPITERMNPGVYLIEITSKNSASSIHKLIVCE